MSIARVTMHEFNEENMHEEVETLYKTIVDEYFPNHEQVINIKTCLLYTSPSPRDQRGSRMPSSA